MYARGGGGFGKGSGAATGAASSGLAAPAATPTTAPRPPPSGPSDFSLVYAGRVIPDGARLGDAGVPPVRGRGEEEGGGVSRHAHRFSTFLVSLSFPQGCQALIAVEAARLNSPPSPTSPYWD